MKIAIQAILWVLCAVFSYQIYDSINGPISFNKIKNERYAQVINRLKIIRKAQIAHKDVKGFYANNFDSLVSFVENGIFTLIEKRDSSYLEYDRTYRIDMLREVVVVDTLGFVPVLDSLFKNDNSYKIMSQVPVEGIDAEFGLKADIISKNGYRVPVFEVKVAKIVLHDQNEDLLKQENETVSVDGVNGAEIILGSMTEVSTNGNWPTIFDAKQPNKPFLSKESILLLGDGFCFCAPGQKKYYPFSDFTGNLEENLASFVQQQSLSDQVQWMIIDAPTAVIPSLNFEEEFQNSIEGLFRSRQQIPLNH